MSDLYELRSIEPHYPLMRDLHRSDSYSQEDRVTTKVGTMVVAIQGDRNKTPIFTYPDLGMNHVSNFQSFFNYSETRTLIQSFCIYHLNAPGQEEDAATLPEGMTYPTMDQLAEAIEEVMRFYGLNHFIGFGMGAGANILARFALMHPQLVDGLFLIHPCSTQSSWTEWGYQKLNVRQLRNSGAVSNQTLSYLLWHHFGYNYETRNHDLVHVYRNFFSTSLNPYNLALFIDSYISRTDLGITRPNDLEQRRNAKTVKNFTCNVFLLTGALSPHCEDTITMNGRLDPTNSSWMKVSDCAMPLEENPAKVVEAFRLYLQGLGYALNQCARRRTSSSVSSLSEGLSPGHSLISMDDSRKKVNIVENPIDSHGIPC